MTLATAPYTDMNDLFVTSASALGIRHEPYFFDRLAEFEFFDFEEARDHAMISIASPMPDIIVERMVKADKAYGGLK